MQEIASPMPSVQDQDSQGSVFRLRADDDVRSAQTDDATREPGMIESAFMMFEMIGAAIAGASEIATG